MTSTIPEVGPSDNRLTRREGSHADGKHLLKGATRQMIARIVLIAALCAAGIWMLWGLLPALFWALVLAVATWPLRNRAARQLGESGAAVLLTSFFTVALLIPLLIIAFQGGREVILVARWLRDVRQEGVDIPQWLSQLPIIGGYVSEWWQNHLNDPDTARELLGRLSSSEILSWTRIVGRQFAARLAILGFTLLTLFFLYRHGPVIVEQSCRVGDRVFGPRTERLANHALAAIRATVNGLVFVGLGEGVLLGIAYLFAGLAHPVLFALGTAVLAIIPFGAPLIIGIAAVVLLVQSQVTAAVSVVIFGTVVVLIADHFIRPILIGSAARLPFMLVLLGIFGGLETFGLVGLFLGPALMAAIFALWKEGTGQKPEEGVPDVL